MTDQPLTHPSSNRLSESEMRDIDAWWRAANYLTIGQIYLLDNPLLREPLRLEHIKPRLLGHLIDLTPAYVNFNIINKLSMSVA